MTGSNGALARLLPPLQEFAGARTDLSLNSLAVVRESLNSRRREVARTLETQGIEVVDTKVPAEGRHIPIRIYRTPGSDNPAMIYCHSGAFVLGNLDTDHRQCVEFARRGRCTVVSVDYRLAPEHPAPAALTDVRAVLTWMAEHADELAIDTRLIAAGGSSAGGALAAGLAQLSAAGQAPALVFQLLHQPALDDRATASKAEFEDTPGFDGPAAMQMWRHYLADRRPAAPVVPARAPVLVGLPPAFISCSELDPLRDEALDYAARLSDADVTVQLHQFAGTCHGFDSLLPGWELSTELFATQGNALRMALYRH